MKHIYKDVFREISKSKGRFISLFLIVALGVAFYAGIRSAQPDMLATADKLYDDTRLMDLRIISTLGLTDADLDAIESLDGVLDAVGNYSADFISKVDEEQSTLKVTALTRSINEVVLKSGRMPKGDNECLLDHYYMKMYGYEVGDTIELLSGNDTAVEDVLKSSVFTISGSFTSPQYLSMDYGSTSIGSGKISGLVMVNPKAFNLDVYTEIDVRLYGTDELQTYSDEYDALVEEQTKIIEKVGDTRRMTRYFMLKSEADKELNKAKADLAKGEKDLEEGKTTFDEKSKELEDTEKSTYSTINDSQAKLKKAKEEYANVKSALDTYLASMSNTLGTMGPIVDRVADLLGRLEKAGLGPSAIPPIENIPGSITIPGANGQDVTITREDAEALIRYEEALAQLQADTDRLISTLESSETLSEFVKTEEITEITRLMTKLMSTSDIREQYAIMLELDGAVRKLYASAAARGDSLIAYYQKQIDDGKAQADKGFADARKELEKAQADIESGEEQLKEGRDKIADAEKQLEELKVPEWYILDRKYFQDYQSYKSDAERVGNIGKVFPLVFFIVAALVCLTTMTRMVDEERTQIGTLKALGYGKLIIIRKYIAYAMLATILGSVAGALVGGKVLPMVIMNVYKMLYPNLEGMELPYNLEHSLVASGASVVCILAATLFACVKTLMENPANLMRPVAPRQGRKLILERIPALWRHIPFTWKNALRNFVRYKKRLFMTLFGIIGSTALLLVGFGIGDAVNTILYAQYGEVFTYNEVLGVNPDAKDADIKALEEGLKKDERFSSYTFVYQSFMDAENPLVEETKEAYLFVPDDVENISRYVTLQDRVTKEPRYMNDDTVLISEKMSKTLNLKPGDTMCLSVDHDNKKEMTVGGIVENYVQNYVYMTPALYKKLYKEDVEYNAVLIKNNEGVTVEAEEFGNEYMAYDAVAAVTCIDTMIDEFADVLKGINAVTYVLIVCAGALTFVVLYNLNNINISERRRELATLKVLGFYDKELSQYIYRENILITIIGVALGVLGGYFLNSYVVTTVEVDMVMFGREIFPMSYVASVLIAIGFTAVVNIIVHFKLKKIDMATSLKSVE